MDIFSSTGIIVCFVVGFVGGNNHTGCKSPQYLETGIQGTVSCSFADNFFSVYWYDTKQYVTTDAIIEYQGAVKRGEGYESGMFDVHRNGSLIISNVSLEHDRFFTAVEVRSVDDYSRHYVRVITTVKPAEPYPVIENCGQYKNMCYTQLLRGGEIICYVKDARPAIALRWMVRTGNGDKNLSSELIVTSSGLFNISTVTTIDPVAYSSGMNLLVCKADSLHGLLIYDESLVIVETDIKDLSYCKPFPKYIAMNSRMDLHCSENEITFFVWKHKQNTDDVFMVTAYGIYGHDKVSNFQSEGYNLSNAGVITIPEVRPEHEGLYACIAGNGSAETISVYEIMAYVSPDPAYPVVEGCLPHQSCVLEVNRKGSLSCSLRGVRPKVTLIWRTLYDVASNEILLHNQETTVTNNEGGTFDVLLTTDYDATRSSKEILAVECKVSEKKSEMFHFSTRLDLQFVQEGTLTSDSDVLSEEKHGKVPLVSWIFILVAVVIVIILVFIVFKLIREKCKKARPPSLDVERDVNVPMLPVTVSSNKLSENELKEKKEAFISQLKTKYDELMATVYPVPYLYEQKYYVNDVFVESGFEFRVSEKKWETLESYQQIFTDPRLISSRRIIEGEAGYGKSILTLQFAHDWCHDVKQSPLSQKDILILLQLRQLLGVKSIFEAIKYYILPKDTELNDTDIERILQKSNSVIILLDGYDEYPDRNNITKSFVQVIMERGLMQQIEVVLTTRTACLPKKYSSQTKRIRLRGFDDIARELYLRKVLAGDDNDSLDKIKGKLNENPFLEDLCHNPLFFVLFCHLSTEEDKVLKFNSVTVFFRHIISCLHSHTKNKATDPEEEKKLEIHEREHTILDKIAFEGLSDKSQRLIWEKQIFCQQLGEVFYHQYVSIGILVEEKARYIFDDPGAFSSEHIKYQQEVRFYHKLFCEWYAAHFLAKYAEKPEVSLDPRHDENKTNIQKRNDPNGESKSHILGNLDPSEVQYLYRFACGLNSTAAEKIYQFITNTQGGDKFAILCLLEQSGKLEKIKPTIEKLCARTVTFRSEHNKLLQRSTIQILEIAAKQQIPISRLWLYNCFQEVCESSRSILLTSGVKIRELHTLLALDVRENGREITAEEAVGIMKYCLQCCTVRELTFKYCLMPLLISTEKLNAGQKQLTKVVWDTGFTSSYSLNYESGLWQKRDGEYLTKSEYEEEAEAFRKHKS